MRSTLLLTGLALLALAGCKGNSLEGKWNLSGEGLVLPGKATLTFAGGKATLEIRGSQPPMGEIAIQASGPYKVEGEKLTMDLNDAEFDLGKAAPQAKAFLDNPIAKQKLLEGLKTKFGSASVKWDSSDQVLLTTGDGLATLTRVKG